MPILAPFLFKLWLWDAREKFELIENYLDPKDKILDIGSGPGSVIKVLREKGRHVTPIDIKDLSFSSDLSPKIFNGKEIPFENNSYDICLLLTVLHHAEEPEKLVSEAKRVAKKVVIVEDIYDNVFQKYLTFFADSLVNLEFFQHPHNNKTDIEWRNLFTKKGFEIEDIQYRSLLFFFRQAVYLLAKD